MSVSSVVVMGVSGSGKSTVGAALAAALGWAFVDGDALHPPANVVKMAAGTPLDDADRAPWLELVGERLAEGRVVIACSALARRYRDRLRAHDPQTFFVLPQVDRATLLDRMASRPGHFMPTSLLDSQFAALEHPGDDEGVLVVSGTSPVADIVAAAIAELGERGLVDEGEQA